MKDELLEIYGHLGAALAQSIPSDDQIIMEHVRDAYDIIGDLLRSDTVNPRGIADEALCAGCEKK